MQAVKLGILHTNDTHSYLDLFGQRAHLIKGLRAQYQASLLLGAGDLFVGGPYFQLFAGQAEIALLNQLGYDAVTFGNHEFDLGPSFLASYLARARVPFVSSNLDFSREPALADLAAQQVAPYRLYDLAAGVRLAVLAATTLETLDNSSPGELIGFEEPRLALERNLALARQAGASHFVLLSHLGYETDLALAQEVPDFAAIIGGHTHTVTEEPALVGQTLVVQAGYYGRLLGELSLWLHPDGSHQLGHYQLHDLSHYAKVARPVAKELKIWQSQAQARISQVIGQSRQALDGSREALSQGHTNLSQLVCRAYAAAARAKGWQVDFSLINGRGVRASLDQGPVTYEEALAILPFGCQLWVLEVTGADLKEALESGHYPRMIDSQGQPLEVQEAVKGLDPEATYQLVTNDFLGRGRDGYEALARHQLLDQQLGSDLDALVAYLAQEA